MYGPYAKEQTIKGFLRINDKAELKVLRDLLTDICTWSSAAYGFCDLKKIIDADISERGGSLYGEDAFYALYWYNYFGADYWKILGAVDQEGLEGVEQEDHSNGASVVIIGYPGRPYGAGEKLARQWKVFAKYVTTAKFSRPIDIDYSAVRSLPPSQPRLGTIGSVVGNADKFIASTFTHTERFKSWARSKGVEINTERDIIALIENDAQIIEDEEGLLPGAVAAYGEIVRQKMGGAWRKSAFFNRGEPVVAKPGRPWTSRRVILEVLQALGNSRK